jgi:hypothetical protein
MIVAITIRRGAIDFVNYAETETFERESRATAETPSNRILGFEGAYLERLPRDFQNGYFTALTFAGLANSESAIGLLNSTDS